MTQNGMNRKRILFVSVAVLAVSLIVVDALSIPLSRYSSCHYEYSYCYEDQEIKVLRYDGRKHIMLECVKDGVIIGRVKVKRDRSHNVNVGLFFSPRWVDVVGEKRPYSIRKCFCWGNRDCGFVVFNNLWRNIRWSLDEISLLPLKKEDGGYYALGSGDPVEEDKRYNADNPTKVKMSYIGRNGEVLYSNRAASCALRNNSMAAWRGCR